MDQLSFDIEVPNTRVWVAYYGEYGARWDQEDKFDDIYFDGDGYVEWVENEAGDVIWGDRPEKHHWGERDRWFGTTLSLIERRKYDPFRWPMDRAIEAGDIEEIRYLWNQA